MSINDFPFGTPDFLLTVALADRSVWVCRIHPIVAVYRALGRSALPLTAVTLRTDPDRFAALVDRTEAEIVSACSGAADGIVSYYERSLSRPAGDGRSALVAGLAASLHRHLASEHAANGLLGARYELGTPPAWSAMSVDERGLAAILEVAGINIIPVQKPDCLYAIIDRSAPGSGLEAIRGDAPATMLRQALVALGAAGRLGKLLEGLGIQAQGVSPRPAADGGLAIELVDGDARVLGTIRNRNSVRAVRDRLAGVTAASFRAGSESR